MKKILIFSLLFAGLTACSSTPKGYGPAYGSDFGYRNAKLQHDRFRVSYTSRDVYESRDFALLRAAQIADIEGYSHFKIINSDTFGNGPNRISGHVGVGYRTHVDIGVQDVVRAVEGHIVTETIEVVLLNSGNKTDPHVYEAQSVLKSIIPPVVQQAKLPSP